MLHQLLRKKLKLDLMVGCKIVDWRPPVAVLGVFHQVKLEAFSSSFSCLWFYFDKYAFQTSIVNNKTKKLGCPLSREKPSLRDVPLSDKTKLCYYFEKAQNPLNTQGTKII